MPLEDIHYRWKTVVNGLLHTGSHRPSVHHGQQGVKTKPCWTKGNDEGQ